MPSFHQPFLKGLLVSAITEATMTADQTTASAMETKQLYPFLFSALQDYHLQMVGGQWP